MLNVEAALAVAAQGRDATAALARVEAVPAPCDLEWVVKRHRVRAALAAQRGDPAVALREARAAVAAADRGALLLVTTAALTTSRPRSGSTAKRQRQRRRRQGGAARASSATADPRVAAAAPMP